MRVLLSNPDNGVTSNFMTHLLFFLLQTMTPPGPHARSCQTRRSIETADRVTGDGATCPSRAAQFQFCRLARKL